MAKKKSRRGPRRATQARSSVHPQIPEKSQGTQNKAEAKARKSLGRKSRATSAYNNDTLSFLPPPAANAPRLASNWFYAALLVAVTGTSVVAQPGPISIAAPLIEKASFAEIVTFTCAALWLIIRFVKQDGPLLPKLEFTPLIWPVLVLTAWGAASFFWAHNTDYVVVMSLQWLTALLTFVMMLASLDSERRIRIFYLFFCGTAAFVSFIGIAQSLYNVDWYMQSAAPASTFNNRNMAMHYMVLCLPATLSLLLLAPLRPRFSRDAYITVVLGMTLLYVLLAQTRAAWLSIGSILFSFAVFMVLNWWFRLRKRPKKQYSREQKFKRMVPVLMLCLLTTIALGYFFSPAPPGFEKRFNNFVGRLSTIKNDIKPYHEGGNSRWGIWRGTWEMFKQNPVLGDGLNSFEYSYENYTDDLSPYSTRRAHNDFLQLLAELGIIGGILFLWMVLTAFYMWLRVFIHLWKSDNDHDIYLFMAPTLGLIGTFVNANFSFPYQIIVPQIILMSYFAIIGAYYLKVRKAEQLDNQNALQESEPRVVRSRLRLPRLSLAFNQKTLIGSAVIILPLLIFVSVLNVRWFGVVRYLSDRVGRPQIIAEATKQSLDGLAIQHYAFPEVIAAIDVFYDSLKQPGSQKAQFDLLKYHADHPEFSGFRQLSRLIRFYALRNDYENTKKYAKKLMEWTPRRYQPVMRYMLLLEDGREKDEIAETYRSIENPKQFADRPIVLRQKGNNETLFRLAKIAHGQKDFETASALLSSLLRPKQADSIKEIGRHWQIHALHGIVLCELGNSEGRQVLMDLAEEKPQWRKRAEIRAALKLDACKKES